MWQREKILHFEKSPNLGVCTLFLLWLKPSLWLVDLNYNFECDWFAELSDNKPSDNNLASELEGIGVLKPITIEEIVIFMINMYKSSSSSSVEWIFGKRALNSNPLGEQRWNSLSAVQTSEDIHSFNATDLFRMAKDGHTHEAIQRKFNVKLPDECGHLLPYETDL